MGRAGQGMHAASAGDNSNSMITFVIVNFNKHDLTLRCVQALRAHTDNFSCVIVDNGSTPENRQALESTVIAKYPSIKYVQIAENDGYGPGANAGLLAADPKNDVVLLNNDCFLTCDATQIIEKAFKETGAGVVGALLSYPDGKIQHDGMDFTPRVPGAFIHGVKGEPRKSRFCVSVTGALLAIRRSTIKKIGILDTRFYLGCEDSDYCLRAWDADIPVWFEQNLTAIHLEGATRGRTAAEKQAIAGRTKHTREVNSVTAFRAKHTDSFMSVVNDRVKLKNRDVGLSDLPDGLKIDIGCGTNPTPGYIACDARALMNVKHVFNFGQDRWPFKDGSVAEIIMQHSIEHVSYRRLPHVLGETRRVLAQGGKLIIRTPDLRFIIDHYLSGKITPEFPPDQEFIAANFGEKANALSPGWWAVLKMFSGQDYPGNEHRFCFDFETLASVLASQGFPNAKRFTDKPVWSPGEIYCEVVKP